MFIGIMSQAVNVALNFVFIVLLDKGVAGAATASCISIVLGSVIMLLMFKGKRMDI